MKTKQFLTSVLSTAVLWSTGTAFAASFDEDVAFLKSTPMSSFFATRPVPRKSPSLPLGKAAS